MSCYSRIRAVSVAPPGVRMVVASAWAWRDDDGAEQGGTAIDPVVAVRSTVKDCYYFPGDRGCTDVAATDAGLRRLGWHFEGSVTSDEPLIVDPESGTELISATEYYDDMSNMAYRIVACPWPPEQDADRLGPVLEELRAAAASQEAARAAARRPAAPREGADS